MLSRLYLRANNLTFSIEYENQGAEVPAFRYETSNPSRSFKRLNEVSNANMFNGRL